MKGFLAKTAHGLVAGLGLATMAGCGTYYSYVDPCWPERYNLQARQSAYEPFDIQAANGRALEQTIWNWQFEPGSDQINGAGLARLSYLSRRRPGPDCKVFVQTAHDVPFIPEPEKGASIRSELDQKRVAAVQRYLTSLNAGRHQPAAFDVAVHDAADPSMPGNMAHGNGRAINVLGSYMKLQNNFEGAVTTQVGGSSTAPGSGGGGAGGGR
ncbi:MAG: hypothetical protein K2X38_15425 [Gemmataceae bacterium]|nr:hypothetical protein [Gemmataceae bacterium]